MSNEPTTMCSGRFRKICSAAIICTGLAFCSPRALCRTGCSPDSDAQAFTVGAGSFIRLPLGRFLLVRKDGHIGAIRITSISPDATAQARGSEWIGRIDYESYYGISSSQLGQSGGTKHTGQLAFGRMKGLGFHYSWQPGNNKALIGSWQFGFSAPDMMFMGKYMGDFGFEFAPTAACELRAIPISDTRLRWFHYDRNSQYKLLVSDLPGTH
jgi:hypothetical protein